jgi:glycosyltransferase involved in cell wall biosynthesis
MLKVYYKFKSKLYTELVGIHEEDIALKISVIVPIYNIRIDYLEQCIESLLNQTYKNIEIILIDDFSTKYECFEMCTKYAQQDDRVILIRNEKNLGPGPTRNKGLEVAHGDYISFVDADDWIALDTFEKLINVLNKGCYDTIIFNAEKVYDTRIDLIPRSVLNNYEYSYQDPYLLSNLVSTDELNGPCYILYSKSIIDKYILRFPTDIRSGEDLAFNSNYFLKSNKGKFIHEVLYYYRARLSSITNTFDVRKFSDSCKTYIIKKNVLEGYLRETEYYEQTKCNLNESYAVGFFRLVMYALQDGISYNQINEEVSTDTVNEIISYKYKKVSIRIMNNLIKYKQFLLIKAFTHVYFNIKRKIKIIKSKNN